jgi:uncharacterized protein
MNSLIAHIILYVQDQSRSTDFYSKALNLQPRLNVPGMTEFELSQSCVLGLMPEAGIERLLADSIPDLSAGRGVPRAELYLLVDDPAGCHARALSNGAAELSPLQLRDWGDTVSYCADPDWHIVAFASRAAAVADHS